MLGFLSSRVPLSKLFLHKKRAFNKISGLKASRIKNQPAHQQKTFSSQNVDAEATKYALFDFTHNNSFCNLIFTDYCRSPSQLTGEQPTFCVVHVNAKIPSSSNEKDNYCKTGNFLKKLL